MNVNRAIKILLVFLFIVNMSDGLFAPLIAVFITGSIAGASIKTVGFATALYSITKSIVQVPLARRIDAIPGEGDDFRALIAGAVITAITTLGFAFIGQEWQLYLLSAFGGVGGASLMAAYYGIFARHVDKTAIGFEWSLFSVGGLTVSAAVGAAAGGVLVETYGFRPVFVAASLAQFGAILLLLVLYPLLDGVKKRATEPSRT